jgi:hypothetical protein
MTGSRWEALSEVLFSPRLSQRPTFAATGFIAIPEKSAPAILGVAKILPT